MDGQTTDGQTDSHSDYNADPRVLKCLRFISGEMLAYNLIFVTHIKSAKYK